ncbi:hypothetical protein DFH07DRAFT_990553, partial [Mycena maculata]
LISKVLRLSTQRIWTTTAERDTLISGLTRPAYYITESEVYMKLQDIKLSVYKVICLAVKHHGHALNAQITIIQSLQFYEYLSEPMAECLAKEFDHTQLGDEVLHEVAGMTFGGQDNKGLRTCSKFPIRYSELAPRLMLKQMSLLLGQLDSEAYPMRIGVVEVIAAIIQDLADAEEDESSDGPQKKQINGLYDLLLERALNVSSYVRTKVLAALARLCDMKRAKFPSNGSRSRGRQWARSRTRLLARMCKGAAALLVRLLLTHPYGLMYGGTLTFEKWEEDYRLLKAELVKTEASVGDGSTVQDQDEEDEAAEKKKKRKGADDSIDVDGEEEDGGDTEIEEEEEEDPSAMAVDGEGEEQKKTPKKKKAPETQTAKVALETNQLLHLRLRKKYYAEALNFIRQIVGTMGTMEKLLGSKSKPEVLEAIKFFRVAHEYQFARTDTVIKKMLHLIWSKDNNSSTSEDGQSSRASTSGCSSATAGSRRADESRRDDAYKDKQIHPDVIAKLWSASINKPLPKTQWQGAIIILRMLALAKCGVLTDHVDVMLKVSLGHLGKCLNGSAKKIKGSLDKTIRIEMDNPIFRKLQEAVEHLSRSKEWFGLAGQAINTVYALGDHPDVLCNDLIKKLTLQAFAPRAKPAPEPQPTEQDQPQELPTERDPDVIDEEQPGDVSRGSEDSETGKEMRSNNVGDVFELSQLLFVVGHVAIKHIVYLELVEHERKRQKDEKDGAEKQANLRGKGASQGCGRRSCCTESLLAVYGPMLVHACGSPHKYKNRTLRAATTLSFSKFLCEQAVQGSLGPNLVLGGTGKCIEDRTDLIFNLFMRI